MKKNRIGRRAIACLLIAAMIPQQVVALAADQAAAAIGNKEDVLVRWLPKKNVIEPGEKGVIQLEARLNKKKKKVEQAEISIHLEPQEVFALCDEKLEDDDRIGIDWRDDGSADLYFELDEDTPRLSRKICFEMPKDTLFDIDVTPEDIQVIPHGEEVDDDEDEGDDEKATRDATPSEMIADEAESSSEAPEENPATPSDLTEITNEAEPENPAIAEGTALEGERRATPSEADGAKKAENAASASEIEDSKRVELTDEDGYIIRRETQALRVKGIRPEWKMDVRAKARRQREKEDAIGFAVSAAPKNGRSKKSLADKEQRLTLTLTMPEWLEIQSGEVTWDAENSQLLIDGTGIARLTGIPEEFVLAEAEVSDEQTVTAAFERRQGEEELFAVLMDEADPESLAEETQESAELSDHTEEGDSEEDDDITPAAELSKLKLGISLFNAAPLYSAAEGTDLTGGENEAEGEVRLDAELKTTSAGLTDEVEESAVQPVYLTDFLTAEEPIQILGTTNLKETVYWIDNGNAEGNRPVSSEAYLNQCTPEIYFTVDGGSNKIALTSENWKTYFGEDVEMPEPVYTPSSEDASVSLRRLPTKTKTESGETHTFQWTMNLTNFGETGSENKYQSPYSLCHITKENQESYDAAKGKLGWYYIERRTLEFDIDVRAGEKKIPREILKDAVVKHFEFHVEASGKDHPRSFLEFLNGRTAVLDEKNQIYHFTLPGMWKYNLDRTPITYSLHDINKTAQGDSSLAGKIPSSDLKGQIDSGDYFEPIYNNTKVGNFGSITTELYNGGTLVLQLRGKRDYTAVKVWADQADVLKRPKGEFQLWRYRDGDDYAQAAPVRDKNGSILTLKLETDPSKGSTQKIQFGTESDPFDPLDKYDPEGYLYRYVVREYLESVTESGQAANQYEQVFGQISKKEGSKIREEITDRIEGVNYKRDYPEKRGTGTIADGSLAADRDVNQEANDWLYDGGTLTNRLSSTVTVQGVKNWNAAAYQDDRNDVTLTMTLYSQKKGDATWTRVEGKEPVTITGFQAENMENCRFSATMPQYDADGNELLYRWIETGVSQSREGAGDTGFQKLSDASASDVRNEDEAGNGDQKSGFSLKHTGENERVPYISVSHYDAATGKSTIENRLNDAVTYTVEKQWAKGTTPHAVTFYLNRTTGGADREVLGSIQLDGVAELVWKSLQPLAGNQVVSDIKAKETKAWYAEIMNLPKYDGNGRLYEYFLSEETTSDMMPTYSVTRDEDGNWHSTIVNGPAGKRILIRKDWLDDGDSAHREPVTIGIYNSETNERIGELALGQNSVWYGQADIGTNDPDKIYIVEEKVGEQNILAGIAGGASAAQNGHSYLTDNHEYKVSYGKESLTNSTEKVYTVKNRRVGTIDFTAVKSWRDGDGSRRTAIRDAVRKINEAAADDSEKLYWVLRLRFQSAPTGTASQPYVITRSSVNDTSENSDTVTINQDGPSLIYTQKTESGYSTPGSSWYNLLDFTDAASEKDKTYAFFNLPKYDYEGVVVNYTLEEVWVNGNGEKVSNQDLSKYTYTDDTDPKATHTLSDLLADYQMSPGPIRYTVGNRHTDDTQEQTVTNRLAGTKTLLWHKQWQDNYNYDNALRPDIYLDIFKGRAGVNEPVTTYMTQYRWSYLDLADGNTNPALSDRHHWHAVIKGVPKYDDEGYELKYFALEKTKVDKTRFDYTPAEYSMTDDTSGASDTKIGTESSCEPGQEENVRFVNDDLNGGMAEQGYYALIEGGTITNRIANTVTIEGQKIWKSIPDEFWTNDENLPKITLSVLRSCPHSEVAGSQADPVAVAALTINSEDWARLQSVNGKRGTYSFCLTKEGQSTVGEDGVIQEDEAKPDLQRYNEHGELYDYTLKEQMEWKDNQNSDPDRASGPSLVYQEKTNAYVVSNIYDSVKGALRVKKLLELPAGLSETNSGFPSITMKLTRTYKAKQGENYSVIEDTSFSKTQTWKAQDVKLAYEAAQNSGASGTEVLLDSSQDDGSGKDPFLFENLDVYAPNGMKYHYYVQEIRENLNDYETWAGKGDLDASENAQTGVKTNANKVGSTKADNTVNTGMVGPIELVLNQKDANGVDGRGKTAESVAVSATVLNSRKTTDLTKIQIQGKKIWNHYSFQALPDADEFATWLTLWRSADAQPGQENRIPEQPVTGVAFKVTKEEKTGSTEPFGEIYSYKAVADGSNPLETANLDRYAPNGMPWKYVVKEVIPDKTSPYPAGADTVNVRDLFRVSGNGRNPAEARVGESGSSVDQNGNRVVSMGDLTNTSLTQVSYSKRWVDKDGNPITADYTGLGTLTVEFELQVKEGESGNWQAASQYFEGKTVSSTVSNNYTPSLSGPLTDAGVWGQKKAKIIQNLPGYLSESGNNILLSYRVVERKVYAGSGEGKQLVAAWKINDTADGKGYTLTEDSSSSGSAEFAGEKLVKPYYGNESSGTKQICRSNTDNHHINQLQLQELSIQKIWSGDRNNLWGTRPAASGSGKDWSVSFVVQRRESGSGENSWENVKQYSADGTDAGDRIVTLRGNNNDSSASVKVSGLPEAAPSGKAYEYRFVELKDPSTKEVGAPDGYTVTYKPEMGAKATESQTSGAKAGKYEVVNTLETVQIQAEKTWIKDDSAPVYLQLMYEDANGALQPVKADLWVKLDGKADSKPSGADAAGYEDAPWHASWTVPKKLPAAGSGDTTYKVVEKTGSGFRQTEDRTNDETQKITNVKLVKLELSKSWQAKDKKPVQIELYRLAGAKELPTDDANAEKLGIVMLNAENNWSWSGCYLDAESGRVYFDKYKADAEDTPEYLYYAKEAAVDGTALEQDGTVQTSDGIRYQVKAQVLPFKGSAEEREAVFSNVQVRDLQLEKTWLDDGNAYHTRPDALTIRLSRSAGENKEDRENLPDAVTEVAKGSGNQWIYTWKNLPVYDMDGNLYTYYAEEENPDVRVDSLLPGSRYICLESQPAEFTDGTAELTNLLKKETDLAGQKIWTDGDGGMRPSEIELTLYRRLAGSADWEEMTGAVPDWYKQADGTWNFVYPNMLQTNDQGVRYYYRVEEAVPDGYHVYAAKDADGNELKLKNIADGSLRVSKEVSGSGGDKQKEFHFTIEVGALPDGSQLADGTYGQIVFIDGRAELTLKDGESRTAEGLPGQITYLVKETEANEDGYQTEAQNDAGRIEPGSCVEAHFVNHRNSSGKGGSGGGSKSGGSSEPTGPALDILLKNGTTKEPDDGLLPSLPELPDPEVAGSVQGVGRKPSNSENAVKAGVRAPAKTGDDANVAGDVLQMLLAGAGILFLLLFRRKKRER